MSQLKKRICTALQSGLDSLKRRHPARGRKPVWLNAYDKGVPERIDIPDFSLVDLWFNSVNEAPANCAISYFGKPFTYKYIHQLMLRFARGMKESGVQQGDRVALILPNIPQYIISYWAALYIGATVVPINPLLSEREFKYQLLSIDPAMIVVLDRIFPRLERYVDTLQNTVVVIACLETYLPAFLKIAVHFKNRLDKTRNRIQKHRNIVFYRQILRRHPCGDMSESEPDDTAILLFTGGVTGTSKCAELSHRNLLANVIQAHAWITDMRDGEEVILACLPLVHSYGQMACHLLSVYTRAKMVLDPRFNAKRVIKLIQKHRITLFPGVPTMFAAMVGENSQKQNSFTSLRACISGGAPLDEGLKKEFEESFGTKLVEGYGLSEASPITHCNPIRGCNKPSSIGIPWPDTLARVVDMESEEEKAAGEIGELWVKGPQVMKRYWQNVQESKAAFRDGWLRTGDLAKVDSEGYFYIVSRYKDLIISGGYNIYPSEIEQVLLRHPDIHDACAVGVDDSFWGQVVKAVVVLEKESSLSCLEIIAFCKHELADYKVPKIIEFVQVIPKNLLGKPLRREL
ncbi:AMP-binding protein [candidate division KSB1 bacterium]|nr:AMP-binding protein [candidate division KSB1 bacterium]